jgi:uncharacterized SAM-binding protein YcdF (DUF218 family)
VRAQVWLRRVLGWPLAVRGQLERVDAIVVLGAPLRPDGTLTAVLAERVSAGVELWRRGVASLLCMTGGVTRESAVAEACAMAAVARAAGVPEEALLVEAVSRNTYENARLLAEELLPRGLDHVVLVTQPFHLRRARLHFVRAGFRAAGHVIADSVQLRSARGLGWILREYPSLLRDALLYLGQTK